MQTTQSDIVIAAPAGLSSVEAAERLGRVGPNVLPRPRRPGLFLLFGRQFLSPLIYILLAAAGVSLLLGEVTDAVFIFVVLIINAAIGTVQELSAQRAADALRDLVPTRSTVLRDGERTVVDSALIVPDDIVLLTSGDKVPADVRLEYARELWIDESLLTGESAPVLKQSTDTPTTPAREGDRTAIALAGTMVTRGRARGTVIATGSGTELGRIARSVSEPRAAKPPLLQRIERFTLRISVAMLAFIAVLFVVALLRGGDLGEMFLIAVALAVAAIPEGLPAAITVALAIGMRRMAARHVVIRKLLAVETLGSCTFIAADKTGTLTINELAAGVVQLPGGCELPLGADVAEPSSPSPAVLQQVKRLCLSGIMANESDIQQDGAIHGDPVDLQFHRLAASFGIFRREEVARHPELRRKPYESENGFCASVHLVENGRLIFAKGGVDKILQMCTRMQTRSGDAALDRDAALRDAERLALSGYRILGLADGRAESESLDANLHDLTFLGVVGMIDPPRSEAKEAVDACRAAGIEVAMITGDHPATARAIAERIGLDSSDHVITGADIVRAEAEGLDTLDALVGSGHVFARIEPTQKRLVVESLMRGGHFVAVTGDGVNDAPALRHAHVGVAMGGRGTDVARESADLIITDDDFASIVKGVHEGRVVYANIRKVVFLLTATGLAEITLFILSMVAGLPMPLLAAQLLWLNLVTNGVQDIALAFEPAEGDELNRPPRRPDEPIFDRLMVTRVLTGGIYMGGIAFAVFFWLISHGWIEEQARNLTLLLMVLLENMQALNARSETRSIFRQRLFGNPFLIAGILAAQAINIAAMYLPGLSDVLDMNPVAFPNWVALIGLSVLLLALDEVFRLFTTYRRSGRNAGVGTARQLR